MELLRQRRRFLMVGALLALAFIALAGRLIDLQVLQHQELLLRARKAHSMHILLKGHRGTIRDVRGEALAQSLPARAIAGDPSLIGPHVDAVARALAPLLQTNATVLAHLLQPRIRTNDLGEVVRDFRGRPITNQFVVLRRKVPFEQWRAISTALNQETFGLATNQLALIKRLRRSVAPAREEDEIRIYPNGSLAAGVIGFTDLEGRGLEGVEAFLEAQLRGVDGFIKTGRARSGAELRWLRELHLEPQHGRDVFLTLDARLQSIVEEALAATMKQFQARGACAVVVEPSSGRILAMASLPSHDLNDPLTSTNDATRRRNWCVAHTFEPGSTFKLVAATAVMNEKLLGLRDMVDCGENGRWTREFGRERVVLRDVHAIKERYAPVEKVISESSNIGTFQLALKLGRERYADYLMRFGFSQRTGIRLPVEERGMMRPIDKWTMTDFSRIAMGYTISVTPLQLAMAMSALANDGKLMRPQIIDRVLAADGTVLSQPQPEMVRQVCRPEVAEQVRRALRHVVEDGTGTLVRMDRFSVAGKTGTARIAPYREDRYHSSFVGFFPVDEPRLCIAVVVEDPNPRIGYYGGKVAGPAFKNIAQRAASYLAIAPDLSSPDDETHEDRDRRLASTHKP